ncbi:cytoplasmic linker associated protein [Homalodisca vitripennis]|nr:cytoplasmic linker associated protein [Homalodisca vitripennis]
MGARCVPPADPDPALWGPEHMWILRYDNIVKHPGGRVKGCHCDIHRPRRPGMSEPSQGHVCTRHEVSAPHPSGNSDHPTVGWNRHLDAMGKYVCENRTVTAGLCISKSRVILLAGLRCEGYMCRDRTVNAGLCISKSRVILLAGLRCEGYMCGDWTVTAGLCISKSRVILLAGLRCEGYMCGDWTVTAGLCISKSRVILLAGLMCEGYMCGYWTVTAGLCISKSRVILLAGLMCEGYMCGDRTVTEGLCISKSRVILLAGLRCEGYMCGRPECAKVETGFSGSLFADVLVVEPSSIMHNGVM